MSRATGPGCLCGVRCAVLPTSANVPKSECIDGKGNQVSGDDPIRLKCSCEEDCSCNPNKFKVELSKRTRRRMTKAGLGEDRAREVGPRSPVARLQGVVSGETTTRDKDGRSSSGPRLQGVVDGETAARGSKSCLASRIQGGGW